MIVLKFAQGEFEELDIEQLLIPNPAVRTSTNILRRIEIWNPTANSYKIETGLAETNPETNEVTLWKRDLETVAATTLYQLTDEIYVKAGWEFYVIMRQDATAFSANFTWFAQWAESR